MPDTTPIYNEDAVIHNVRVDFANYDENYRKIKITQYDDSLTVLAVKVYKNGEEFAIPNNKTLRLRWGVRKDNQQVVTQADGFSQDRKIVYFVIKEQMTLYPGLYNPIVEMLEMSGQTITARVGSSAIPVLIKANPVKNSN